MHEVASPSIGTCCGALARLPWGLVHPQRADPTFLASLANAGLPAARVQVTVLALPQVARAIPTPFIAEGVYRPRRIANAMTAFVVRHPDVSFVVDPSICTDVVTRAVAQLPFALRVVVKPPSNVVDLRESLERAGIAADELAFALPTHLHWDHVSGLLDFPDMPIRLHRIEREWAMSGPVAPVGGVRPAVQGRAVMDYDLDGPPVLTFPGSHDLLGDGSVTLVDLAGHTPGSVGVLLHTARGPVLLAGDAAWHSTQIEHIRPKASYPGMLADEDRQRTFHTLHRLHAAQTSVHIVPTHDADAAQQLRSTA